MLWNSVTGAYTLAPMALLSGGSLPDAPNDGLQYGRQSLGWTQIVIPAAITPSGSLPVMNGIAAAGAAVTYSRGDHVHPTDTSLSSFLQAGTGAVTRTMQDKTRERVSVKDFNAVGNGSTDDTAAIQAAITAFQGTGATIFFPRGTYKITSSLNITGTIRFEGESRDGSAIFWTNTIFNAVVVSTLGRVAFEKLTFSGPVSATAGASLTLDGPSGTGNGLAIIRDCTFAQGFNHVVTVSAADWTIDNCYFSEYVNFGVYVGNVLHNDAGDSTIMACTFATSLASATAIHQVSSGGLKIIGNKMINGQYGYHMVLAAGGVATVDLVIGNNSIEGQSAACVLFDRPTGAKTFGGITITGNQFSGPSIGATASWACISTDANAGWLGRITIVGNHILMAKAGVGGLTFIGVSIGASTDGFIISGNQFSAESPTGTSVGINIASGAANGIIGPNNYNILAGSSGSWTNKILNASATTYVTNYATQSGTVAVTCSTADGATWSGTAAVVFPVAYDLAPKVVCTAGTVAAGIAAFPTSVTKTGFTVVCHSGSNGGAGNASWDAVGVL